MYMSRSAVLSNLSQGGRGRIHTASTPCLDFLPTSTLNTQWLLHFRSRASPSNPVILLSVVLTERPSKCNQSNGAGLLGLKRTWVEVRGRDGGDAERGDGLAGGVGGAKGGGYK